MRPVIEKQTFKPIHLIYIIIILICIVSIGFAVYMQFFKDEKMGVIFGIASEEDDDEIINLKEKFYNLFDNNVEIISGELNNVNKIKNTEDVVVLAYNLQEQTDKYLVDIKIPYLNINHENGKKINIEIKNIFKDKFESIVSSSLDSNIIYNVKYKAYINDDILSLIILSELKEGNSSQRIIVQTYNYSLSQNKQVLIDEILTKKHISNSEASLKIKNEIKNSREQNNKLAELGYNINVREEEESEYKIENSKNYFLGKNGYLFLLYPYGNDGFTSEMDIIIFK